MLVNVENILIIIYQVKGNHGLFQKYRHSDLVRFDVMICAFKYTDMWTFFRS